MSYGHADTVAKAAGGTRAADTSPIDLALHRREDVRRILAARDIGALYRVLKDDAGLTQRRIAELTGQSQSEVSEILAGRRVRDVTVLERICDGLGNGRATVLERICDGLGNGRADVQALALADSTTALSRLEYPEAAEAADTELAKARELWAPTPADAYGDLDRPAACLALKRGRLDKAEQFAAASVRRWEGGGRVSRALSGVVLATIHVRAGEPDGLRLAHHAVTAASKLTLVRARSRLVPLVAALRPALAPMPGSWRGWPGRSPPRGYKSVRQVIVSGGGGWWVWSASGRGCGLG